jgi:hypothetical protein
MQRSAPPAQLEPAAGEDAGQAPQIQSPAKHVHSVEP